jgi:GTP-binding protein
MDIAFLTSAFRTNQYPPPDRPEIAFAGKSNVGKSSLINVLVNRKGLARTSSRPGRTQSINFFTMGKSLYLVDLPGYGFARVPVKVKKSWQGMVETYLSERSNLKAVVVILDIRRDASSGDIDLLSWLKHYGIHAIPVLTKADKLSRQKARTRASVITRKLKDISPTEAILFSAKTKEGREEIWDKIRRVSDSDLPVPR